MKGTIRGFGIDEIQLEAMEIEIEVGGQKFRVTVEDDEFLRVQSGARLTLFNNPRATNMICLKSVEW